MAVSPARENILKNIRQALSNPVPLPFPHSEGTQPVFKSANEDLLVQFAEEFTKLQGRFAFCTDLNDLKLQLQQLLVEKHWTKIFFKEDKIASLFNINSYPNLASCEIAVTGCEYLVARTGTVVMSTAQQSGRTTSVYAPIHICVAFTNQVVYDIKDALQLLKEKYAGKLPSLITFASGPSRTADIEKTLVTGVHGPKEVYCFLVEA